MEARRAGREANFDGAALVLGLAERNKAALEDRYDLKTVFYFVYKMFQYNLEKLTDVSKKISKICLLFGIFFVLNIILG